MVEISSAALEPPMTDHSFSRRQLSSSSSSKPFKHSRTASTASLASHNNPRYPTQQPNAKRRRLNKDKPLAPSDATTAPQTHQSSGGRKSPSTTRTREKRELQNGMIKDSSTAVYHHDRTGADSSYSKDDKRSLRSKDGSRPKSALASYFPDYEDIIFGIEHDEEFLTQDTLLHITDATPKTHSLPIRAPTEIPQATISASDRGREQDDAPGSNDFLAPPAAPQDRHLPAIRRVDFASLAENARDLIVDPLEDESYLASHRRAERKEKQQRNIDKEHAMHEKSELERLLGELRGPDWLRAMGISGITETEKRELEPKRDLFIQKVRSLLDRFVWWKEQERQLKMKREAELAKRFATRSEDISERNGQEVAESDDEQPHSSEADASARQLLQEAHASKTSPSTNNKATIFRLPEPFKPFTSFYNKSHLREAAVGKHRRGRNVTAFGHPVPEVEETDFNLPAGYATEALINANARKRRRWKRESRETFVEIV